jgi:hypothetical protein
MGWAGYVVQMIKHIQFLPENVKERYHLDTTWET